MIGHLVLGVHHLIVQITAGKRVENLPDEDPIPSSVDFGDVHLRPPAANEFASVVSLELKYRSGVGLAEVVGHHSEGLARSRTPESLAAGGDLLELVERCSDLGLALRCEDSEDVGDRAAMGPVKLFAPLGLLVDEDSVEVHEGGLGVHPGNHLVLSLFFGELAHGSHRSALFLGCYLGQNLVVALRFFLLVFSQLIIF